MHTAIPAFPRRRHWCAVVTMVVLGTALFIFSVWAAVPSPETRALSDDLEQAREALVVVIVAAHELPAGQKIYADDLTEMEVHKDCIPDAAIRSVDRVIGRVPTSRILKHEYIRGERFRAAR